MAGKKRDKISPRHKLMVQEYLTNGFNKTAAASSVGYHQANAYISRLFSRPDVLAEIERIQNARQEKFEITDDWVIKRLMMVADANLSDIMEITEDGNGYLNLEKMTPELKYALTEFTVEEYTEGRGDGARNVKRVKIKPADKMQALIALARHCGLFNDKLTVSGEVSLVEKLNAGRARVAQQAASRDASDDGDDE